MQLTKGIFYKHAIIIIVHTLCALELVANRATAARTPMATRFIHFMALSWKAANDETIDEEELV